jgi:urease accessory protein
VHSFGLECLRVVTGMPAGALESALKLRLEQSLARLELVFVHHAFDGDLVDLDRQLHALLLARESREASAAIGTSFLRSVGDLLDDARLNTFVRDGVHHHHPVAFGAVCASLEIPPTDALQAYALGSVRGQVSAAQRLGWLGQREAQRILHALKPTISQAVDVACQLSPAEAGAFTPVWDIAAMHHEVADVRMFAS